MKYTLTIFLACITQFSVSAIGKKVLFIGNSYTASNDLPGLVAQVAASVGDNVTFESVAPGGYTFQLHTSNASTTSEILSGLYDFVVLQEQSQLPSFPMSQVASECFPYAYQLDSMVHAANPCAKTIFFMTWGRKNGDQGNCPNWPPVCTYEGMDSLLHERYRTMADSFNAMLSPVGALWKYIRTYQSNINLYSGDGSHPSMEGSYAAACAFYTMIFKKDPMQITFEAGLPHDVADSIKSATKTVVYDSLAYWNAEIYDPVAAFTDSANVTQPKQIFFTNTSTNAQGNDWNFGDGNASTDESPNHTYANNGTYTVRLIVERCNEFDTVVKQITVGALGIKSTAELKSKVYPNPVIDQIIIDNKDGLESYVIQDLQGRAIQSGSLKNGQNQITITSLSKGLYSLILSNKTQRYTQKIVVGQ